MFCTSVYVLFAFVEIDIEAEHNIAHDAQRVVCCMSHVPRGRLDSNTCGREQQLTEQFKWDSN